MRFTLLLLFSLSISCSASAPSRRADLCDGAELCPPEAFVSPGYTPAGAGLPEYRPVKEEPQVPRSLHRRNLPQTPQSRREPTLWAGDEPQAEPQATRHIPPRESEAHPWLLWLRLETPDGVPEIASLPSSCAAVLGAELRRVPSRLLASVVDPEKKQCAAARLYAACLEYWKRKDPHPRGPEWDWERARKWMRDLVREKCAPPANDDDVGRLVSAVYDRLGL